MEIVLIAHNIRSTHNIGSIFRSCDGFGVSHIYLSGYSPYPSIPNDTRLPHIHQKLTAQIAKTALGAESTVSFSYSPDPHRIIANLQSAGYSIWALEQSATSVSLPHAPETTKVAILIGEEVNGIETDLLKKADVTVEIPMYGTKESFNVSVAAGIVLYALKEHVRVI